MRFGKVKNAFPRNSNTSDEEDSIAGRKQYRLGSPGGFAPPPPSPKFKTLLPNERLNFEGVRKGVADLEDQCERLMGTLEETRRALDYVTAEKDHYKEFWQAMNNYHSVMSRFQVPTATIQAAPFGSQPLRIPPLSSHLPPLSSHFPPLSSHFPSQPGNGHLMGGYPMHRAPFPDAAYPDRTYEPSPALKQTTQQAPIQSDSPIIPGVTLPNPNQLSPATAPTRTFYPPTAKPPETPTAKPPETPKRDSSKPIDAYFSASKSSAPSSSAKMVDNAGTGPPQTLDRGAGCEASSQPMPISSPYEGQNSGRHNLEEHSRDDRPPARFSDLAKDTPPRQGELEMRDLFDKVIVRDPKSDDMPPWMTEREDPTHLFLR